MARVVAAVAIAAFLATSCFASVGFDNCTGLLVNNYVPQAPAGNVKICREGAIAIAYDPAMVNPAYSAYYVTVESTKHSISGRDSFYEDPDLRALGIKQADVDSDAFNMTWNRGHLCPNHIMSWSESSKKATFTMANVAPQAAYFNQHPWNYLENDVLTWISSHVSLHMITGIAYKSRSNSRRTFDNIAVPDYYFKVLCDTANRESVGFIGDNNGDGPGTSSMHTVMEVEQIFGGYLFPYYECNIHTVNKTHWWSSSDLRRMSIEDRVGQIPVPPHGARRH